MNRRAMLAICCMILCVLAACQPIPPQPPEQVPLPQEEPMPQVPVTRCDPLVRAGRNNEGSYQALQDECIVRDQLLVLANLTTGVNEEIKSLIGDYLTVEELGKPIALEEHYSFGSYLSDETITQIFGEGINPAILVYQYVGNGSQQSVADPEILHQILLGAINFEKDNGIGKIYPNFDSLADSDQLGCDYDDVGVMYESESPGAHPIPIPEVGTPGGYSFFLQQWAFYKDTWGIDLYELDADGQPSRRPHATGVGQHIVVLDTSPFDKTGDETITFSDTHTMNLNVSHPFDIAAHISTSTSIDVSNHGLYVAALAHTVAPSSTMHLVQVLNNEGIGSMQLLVDSLHGVIQEMAGDLPATTINMSLGTITNTDVLTPALQVELYEFMLEHGVTEEEVDEILAVNVLEKLLDSAKEEGATIVAAAGNSGCNRANYPARFSSVLGVMSSTQSGGRACYSNWGDVAAPNGNTNMYDLPHGVASHCDADLIFDCDHPDCHYAVISVVDGKTNDDPEEYAFWAGTSFAAPLVSGLCAIAKSDPEAEPNSICTSRETLWDASCESGINVPAHVDPPGDPHVVNLSRAFGEAEGIACPTP